MDNLSTTGGHVLLAFCIWDYKAALFSEPVFIPNRAMAVRYFKDLVNATGSLMNRNPEDFSLWYVGSFDTGDALFQTSEKELVINATELVKPPFDISKADDNK